MDLSFVSLFTYSTRVQFFLYSEIQTQALSHYLHTKVQLILYSRILNQL